jgi:hypothetical protein
MEQPTTRVEARIAAARYFLRKLVDGDPPHPEFDWLLEAFLSAARSVGWIMRAEAGNQGLLDEWQALNPPVGDVENVFGGIVKARNRIEKQSPVSSKVRVSVLMDESTELARFVEREGLNPEEGFDVHVKPGGGLELRSADGAHVFTGQLSVMFSEIEEFPHQPVLDVCEKYMQHLEGRYRDWLNYRTARLGVAQDAGKG